MCFRFSWIHLSLEPRQLDLGFWVGQRPKNTDQVLPRLLLKMWVTSDIPTWPRADKPRAQAMAAWSSLGVRTDLSKPKAGSRHQPQRRCGIGQVINRKQVGPEPIAANRSNECASPLVLVLASDTSSPWKNEKNYIIYIP